MNGGLYEIMNVFRVQGLGYKVLHCKFGVKSLGMVLVFRQSDGGLRRV